MRLDNGSGRFRPVRLPALRIICSKWKRQSALDALLAEIPLRRSLMSHTLRRMQRPNQKHLRIIESNELPTFWREERLPSPLEQADNLILWIGDNQTAPSAWTDTTQSAIAAMIGIPVSAEGNDAGGWSWLNTELSPKKLYRAHADPGKVRLQLEFAGWEKYAALRKERRESRTAFMALKFGDATINRMVEECARPAVKRTGFDLRILTDQQRTGLIDNQIRAALLSARFVISDLGSGIWGGARYTSDLHVREI